MKEKQFSIRDIKVHQRIKAESGYTAQTRNAAGQNSRLTSLTIATENEKGVINEYITMAANECATAIARYFSPCSLTVEDDPDDIEYKIRNFTLLLPENYPEENAGTLAGIVMDFICNRCMQQWYMLVRSEDAGTMTVKAQSSMAQLRDQLSIRKKPHKNRNYEKHNIYSEERTATAD